MNKLFLTTNDKGGTIQLLLFFLPYVIPVGLLATGTLPYNARDIILISLTIAMIFYARWRKYTLQELGLTFHNFKSSLFIYGGLSIIIVLGMILFYKLNLIRPPVAPDYDLFFVFYVFVSCPCQEYLYRSLVYAEFKRLRIDNRLFVIISALNYSYLHLFYHDWITLIITFIIGLIWDVLYTKYTNYFSLAFSHAVLGVVSMLVGIV